MKIACSCLGKLKLHARFKTLGPYEFDRKFLSPLRRVNPGDLCILTEVKSQAKINGAVGLMWAKAGLSKYLRVMNAYELIEIYLGNLESYKSIFELKMDILVLMYGYSEFENRRQSDIILQTMENRRRLGLQTWFVNLGKEIPAKLSKVASYMQSSNYEVVNLSCVRGGFLLTQ